MSNKSKLGWLLLSGASLAAMGAMSPAFAQDDEVSDEIVVTATGRSAAIQDVPIAVTAIGHEALENAGVNSLIDLRQVTPNLRIGSGQSQSSGTSASIRGLGTGSDNPGFEAAVGIFIDGVYRARAGAAINDMADVERIEILRGPQGTLYGKNTTAGAISVVTAGPDFEPSMWMEGSAGDLELLGTRFGANIPLSDTFALRADGTIRARDGYIDVANIPGQSINTTDRWTGRLQAQWDISNDASLRVIVDGSETNELCCAAVTFADTTPLLAANGSFRFSEAMNLTQAGSVLTPNAEARRLSVTPGRLYDEHTEDFGVSGQLDWSVGDLNITSITAYRNWDSLRDQDIDFSAMDRAYRDDLAVGVETLTQEIRLQGEFGRVNWLIGGFYGDETITQTDNIRYGTQADDYINNLLGLFNFQGVGAPDLNGGTPASNGTGQTVFGCNPGLGQCAIPFALGAFNAFLGPLANAAVPGTAGAGGVLGPGGLTIPLTLALSAANLTNQGQQGDVWGVDTTTFALFTHNEISLTDDLVLTVGARYTQEEKDMSADLNANQAACDAIRTNRDAAYAALVMEQIARANLPVGHPVRTLALGFPSALTLTCNPAVNNVQSLQNGGVYGANVTDDAISGTVSLAYHLNDDMMIYGGYSRGFKSGGFNIDQSGMAVRPWTAPGGAAALSPYAQSVVAYLTGLGLEAPTSFGAGDLDFDPETVDAYELGLKSTFGFVTLNLAGYYQQLHDYQLNAFNGFNFITRNVPEVVSQGVEIELAARPTDALTLTVGAHYSDVYYDSTVAFAGNQGNPDDVVRSGDPLAQSPEWTVTGSALYEIPLGDALKLSLYGNGRYVSDYRLQTLGRNPLTDQPSFTIFDARIGLGAQDDRWAIEVWGRNLTDEYYSIGAFAVPEQTIFNDVSALRQGVFAAYPNEPRTVGVTIRGRY